MKPPTPFEKMRANRHKAARRELLEQLRNNPELMKPGAIVVHQPQPERIEYRDYPRRRISHDEWRRLPRVVF